MQPAVRCPLIMSHCLPTVATDSSEEDVEEMEAGGTRDGPQQSLLRYRVRLNHRRKPSDPQRADGEQRLATDESDKDTKNLASRPWHTRGRGDASADDSLRREVGSQSLNTVDEDDADARHLLGPLLDDLGDGGPSTNRRG